MVENPYQSPQVPEPQQAVEPLEDGKHCPACGEDIGVWPVFAAIVPGYCRCPHCRSRLVWSGAYSALAVMIALTLAVCGLGYLILLGLEITEPWQRGIAFAVICLPLVLGIGWIGALYQRRHSVLCVISKAS